MESKIKCPGCGATDKRIHKTWWRCDPPRTGKKVEVTQYECLKCHKLFTPKG